MALFKCVTTIILVTCMGQLIGCKARNSESDLQNNSNYNPGSKTDDTRTTRQGATFERVGSSELQRLKLDPEFFGEAWRDPEGLVWGDQVYHVGLNRREC